METHTILQALTQKLNKKMYQSYLQIKPHSHYLVIFILACLILLIPGEAYASPAGLQQDVVEAVIVGRVIDSQGVPVIDAEVLAITDHQPEPLAEAQSQEDGSWVLVFPEIPLEELHIIVEHPHFHSQTINLQSSELSALNEDDIYQIDDVTLERRISAGFWVAAIVFVGVLLLIAFESLHSTTAALAGVSINLLDLIHWGRY